MRQNTNPEPDHVLLSVFCSLKRANTSWNGKKTSPGNRIQAEISFLLKRICQFVENMDIFGISARSMKKWESCSAEMTQALSDADMFFIFRPELCYLPWELQYITKELFFSQCFKWWLITSSKSLVIKNRLSFCHFKRSEHRKKDKCCREKLNLWILCRITQLLLHKWAHSRSSATEKGWVF